MTETSDPSPSVPPLSRRGQAWLLVALALLLGGSFPYLSRMMNANERPRVLQAIAWVDAGELAIDGPAARGIPAGIDVSRSPVDGRLYPNKPPGTTMAAAVGYATLRALWSARSDEPTLRDATWAMRMAGGLIPALLLIAFIFRRFAGSAATIVPATALVVIATPVVSYARLLFGHMLAASLLFIGLVMTADALQTKDASRRAFFGGLLAGAAVLVEYGAAFGGVALAWLVVRRLRDPQTRPVALSAISGAAVPIAALAIYHDMVFGGPLQTPYQHVVDPAFAATHAQGLLGLSLPTADSLFEHGISPWGGLLYWAPLCVLSLGLAVARWRTLSVLAQVMTVTFAVLVVFNLGLSQSGGWRVGPRYLLVGMPLCIVPLAECLPAIVERRWLAVVAVGVVLWSTFVNFFAGNLLGFLIPTGNPLADQLLPIWTGGYAPYGVLSGLGGPSMALSLTGFITLVVVAWAVLSWPWPSSRRLFGVTAGGVAVAMVAIVGAMNLPPASDAERSLAALRSIWEPNEGLAVAHTILTPLSEPE